MLIKNIQLTIEYNMTNCLFNCTHPYVKSIKEKTCYLYNSDTDDSLNDKLTYNPVPIEYVTDTKFLEEESKLNQLSHNIYHAIYNIKDNDTTANTIDNTIFNSIVYYR